MSLLALIPARGGSKGIPRKNIRPFCGKPLLQWSIDVALDAPGVDRVVVSTDDPEIAEVALACGAEVPFMRPQEFATDNAPGIASVMHALQHLPEVSNLLLMQPTSPLRRVEDVEAAIAMHQEASSVSIVSVNRSNKHPAWMFDLTKDKALVPLMNVPNAFSRQQLPLAYVINGALYLASRSFLETERSFLGPRALGYVMPEKYSLDIDTQLDWEWAEFLMRQTLLP